MPRWMIQTEYVSNDHERLQVVIVHEEGVNKEKVKKERHMKRVCLIEREGEYEVLK